MQHDYLCIAVYCFDQTCATHATLLGMHAFARLSQVGFALYIAFVIKVAINLLSLDQMLSCAGLKSLTAAALETLSTQ